MGEGSLEGCDTELTDVPEAPGDKQKELPTPREGGLAEEATLRFPE